jgi:hypothetical protein
VGSKAPSAADVSTAGVRKASASGFKRMGRRRSAIPSISGCSCETKSTVNHGSGFRQGMRALSVLPDSIRNSRQSANNLHNEKLKLQKEIFIEIVDACRDASATAWR